MQRLESYTLFVGSDRFEVTDLSLNLKEVRLDSLAKTISKFPGLDSDEEGSFVKTVRSELFLQAKEGLTVRKVVEILHFGVDSIQDLFDIFDVKSNSKMITYRRNIPLITLHILGHTDYLQAENNNLAQLITNSHRIELLHRFLEK